MLRQLAACLVGLLLAGCSDPAPEAAAPEVGRGSQQTLGVAGPPASEAIAWHGNVGIWDCAGVDGVQPPTCPVAAQRPATDATAELYYLSGLHGPSTLSGNVTLTWTPETDTSRELRLLLVQMQGCATRCQASMTLARAAGASPLTISADGLNLTRDDHRLAVYVAPMPVEAGPATLLLSTGQRVFVEGTLVATPT